MSHRRPLPPELAAGAFRTAEARRLGLSADRLRAADLEHPFHGVATTDPGASTALDRCRQYAPRLRGGQAFSHTTALQLRGLPVPLRLDLQVHISVAFPRTPPRVVGATGHALRRVESELLDGLPVSAVEAAWCEAAAFLRREELAAVGDALITGPRRYGVRGPGMTEVEALTSAVAARRRMPGADRARWALARIRSGVDSPAETRLRLLLLGAGLPEPDVDVPIEVGGSTLHADLGYPTARLLLEYEGDGHRVDRGQWMRDIRRRELLEDAGFRVVRIVAADIREPNALIGRVRRLLASR